MIKHLFVWCLCTIASLPLFCQQSDSYVEVVVEDTVNYTPDEVIFSVVYSNLERYYADITTSSSSAMKNNKGKTPPPEDSTLKKLMQIVAASLADTLPAPRYSLQNERYTGGTASKQILLKFKNANALQKFVAELDKLNGITASIVLKQSAAENRYNQALLQKLLNKAFTEANFIAEQSKKTLGKLLQVVHEPESKQIGGWTSYPPLSAIVAREYGVYFNEYQITATKTIRVRYAWQ